MSKISAVAFTPSDRPLRSLRGLRAEAARCTRCPLYRKATQTVFGEGPAHAALMLIGEQPGEHEDLAGKPFIGPAGKLLDSAIAQAGIAHTDVYVTNAVKHFKWTAVGKRRLHEKPSAREIRACRPWLEAELALVQPEVVVALGATAAQALMGPSFRVTQQRGKIFAPAWAHVFVATMHPAAILRAPRDRQEEMRVAFVADLKVAARALRGSARRGTPT